MTKMVRVENADTTSTKLVVEVWVMDQWNRPALEQTFKLDNPTEMACIAIYSKRWLVVKEVQE